MNVKSKRVLFRFNGEKPTTINLEHVTTIQIEINRITFTFHTNSLYIDMENEDAAKACYEQLLNAWGVYSEADDVVE